MGARCRGPGLSLSGIGVAAQPRSRPGVEGVLGPRHARAPRRGARPPGAGYGAGGGLSERRKGRRRRRAFNLDPFLHTGQD